MDGGGDAGVDLVHLVQLECAFQGTPAAPGARGFNGTGGGGGGSGGSKRAKACGTCSFSDARGDVGTTFGHATAMGGRGADGAPGGCGGGGGAAGGGGGGAFALVLANAKITLQDSTIDGGEGGKGGAGGSGITGADGSMVTGIGHGDEDKMHCGALDYYSGAGGMGGIGGNGGAGGGGAGGTGGPAVTIALVGDSLLTKNGTVDVKEGVGGTGGAGGAGPGNAGEAGLAGTAVPEHSY